MSLIVARQVNGDIYLVCDTKFTAHADTGTSQATQYFGGLKAVILSPGLCVCFAGNVEIARDAIQDIYYKDVNLFDKRLAIAHFLAHHRRSVALGPALETDFIVASIVESDWQVGMFEKELFRIAGSVVNLETNATHIGDSTAFARFQEAFHGGVRYAPVPTFEISKLGAEERPDFDKFLSTSIHAMQAVIDDATVPSVDGIRTTVISEGDEFKYVEYVQVRGQPIPVRNEPGAPVTFGGAEKGADEKYVGMFSAPGHGVFPVYSITGRFGLIYHPEKSFKPSIHSNCTLGEFRLLVDEELSAAHQRALAYQARF